MFASITCPACKHKFTIPEGAMGSRQICPNCQSPFLAGKSVSEKIALEKGAADPVPMKYQPAPVPAAAINKTMLGETEPPVRYNCPRCKKPLESPASEAGLKKPCPSCGQRLQVPAAPPPAATQQPGLNKTMLTSADGSPPSTGIVSQMPATPPPAATMLPSQAPAAPTPNHTMRNMGIAAGLVGGLVVVLLLTCILSAVIRNSGPNEQALAFAKLQEEFEKYKKEADAKKADLEQRQKYEAEQQKKWDFMMAELKSRQEAIDKQRELDAKNLAFLTDKKAAEEARLKREAEQAEIDRQKKDSEKKFNDLLAQMKAESEASRKALEAANLAASQKQAIIINSPPPPPAYYPWHPRYYWGW